MASVVLIDSVKVKNAGGTVIDPAVEHILATSPHACRLTDGTSFYKATTPSDTQPISAASLPLPTGAATQSTLATLLLEATFTGRIGEVQATPTANTLLSRLKAINDTLVAGLTVALSNSIPSGTNTIGSFNRTTVTSSSITSVASSVTSVQLLASNSSAKKRHVFNSSTASLYLKEGATASTSSFTVKLDPGDYYEFLEPLYTGVVHGIWDSANGSAIITES